MVIKYNIYYYNIIDNSFLDLKERYSHIDINLIDIKSIDSVKLNCINDIMKMYNSDMPIYDIETDHFIEFAAIGDNVYRLLELDLMYEDTKARDRLEYLEEV